MYCQQPDWAAKWALYCPDKIAIREYERNRTLTYGELHRISAHLVNALKERFAIHKGERVAVIAENCLEYIALLAAAQKSGMIIVPLNYRLSPSEVAFLLGDAKPGLVIVEEKYRHLLEKWDPGSTPVLSMTDFESMLEEFRSEQRLPDYQQAPIEEDHPVFILYTSGTTGFPKGALYTHKMLFWNSINTAMSLIVNTESRTVNCMPPFHTGGWNVLMTPFLHHGGYTCMLRKFDPETVLTLLQEERATIFMGVPTILKMMADLPGFDKAVFPDLYYLIVGGEPMPIPLIERWHAKNVMVRQGYGLTEVGPNLTSLHQQDAIRKKGSIGRPNYYVQIRIVDADGFDCPVNVPGELLLKGPMVMPGYWHNPEGTAKALVDGWFHTGDMVRQDEEHYLYVVDRIKNMYKSGGENVYPAEVERILLGHTAISEVAVIGIPDEKWGETGMAFVVLKPGQEPDETSILDYCRENLAKFKVPKSIRFIASLPKNDTGKINRNELKKIQ